MPGAGRAPSPAPSHEDQMTDPAAEIARRRTFAIISHPDAGKTTLTEHLLRVGGAIQLAGNVRAKGERRRTRSDWMGIERERGISVVTSVVTFINKMDRESRDPIELLDEIASTLALDTAPVTWPVGRAAEFAGTYDLRSRDMRLVGELPQSDRRLQALADEVDLIRAALPEF